MKQIFIGGTGRSGTTILSEWLGSHSTLERFPHEARFHIDSGGVLSLFNALTRDYSMDQARMAYSRFRKMMTKELVSRASSPYQGIDLSKTIGPTWNDSLNELEKQILIEKFIGWDYHTNRSLPRTLHAPAFRLGLIINRLTRGRLIGARRILGPKEEMYAMRRLDMSQAYGIFGKFLAANFDGWAKNQGASGWCEDTPANALHMRDLMGLLPRSRFVVIVRNPYGTVGSWTRQIWAPDDFEACVELLASLYQAIIAQISSLTPELNRRLMIVRLEDFHLAETQSNILDFVGVARGSTEDPIKIRKVDQSIERAKLTIQQAELVGERLKFISDFFEYSSPTTE